MLHNRLILGFCFISMMIIVAVGCSDSGYDKYSTFPGVVHGTTPADDRQVDSGHVLWSICELAFDPATGGI
jgi:hypothetical protein